MARSASASASTAGCFSEPSGVDFALSLEPVFLLVTRCEAAHFGAAVGQFTDPAMTLGRGQPVRDQVQRPQKIALDDRRRLGNGLRGFCLWNPTSPWKPGNS